MKIKHLIIVSLILAILTIGAVSASEDISQDIISEDTSEEVISQDCLDDDLTASDDEQEIDSNDEDTISSCDLTDKVSTDERRNVTYEINIPKSVRAGPIGVNDEEMTALDLRNCAIHYFFMDGDASGNFSILIDNKQVFTAPINRYTRDYFNLNNLNLAYGIHDVQVKYAGDENYLPFNVTGSYEYYYMKFVDEPALIGYGPHLRTIFALDATGTLEAFVDGSPTRTYSVYDERHNEYEEYASQYLYIDLPEDIILGNHSYELRYSGGNYPDKTLAGKFLVDYEFSVYNWELETNQTIDYGDEISVYITLVEEAGTLTLNLNGVTHDINITHSHMEYTLPELKYGINNLTFTYENSKYPSKQVKITANVASKINGPTYTEIIYGNDKNYSVLLPSDANGNLMVYEGLLNYSTGSYDYTFIKKATVTDGKASVSVSDMDLGYHTLLIRYDGTDYSVENLTTGITIVPKLVYPTGVWTDSPEEYNITAILPDSAKGNLTIGIYTAPSSNYDYYGFEPQLVQIIYNGTAQNKIDLKMPSLSVGNYNLKVAYEDDYTDLSHDNYFSVKDDDPDWQMEFDFPATLYITYEYDNELWYRPSNVPSGANGKLTLYIDGKEVSYGWFNYGDYEFEWYYSQISEGNHTWKLGFTNDTYYKDTSLNGNFTLVDTSHPTSVHIVMYESAYIDDKDDYFALIYSPEDANGTIVVLINGVEKFRKPLKECRKPDEYYLIGPSDVNYEWKQQTYDIQVKYINGNYDDFDASETVAVANENGGGTVNPGGNGNNQAQTPVSTPTSTSPSAPAKENVKLTLKKVTVKKSAKKLVLQATLKINGKAVKGKTIKFKFNGKTYKAKTNKKGVAKVTIKKAVLKKLKVGKKVKIQATYNKTTKKLTVKIKK